MNLLSILPADLRQSIRRGRIEEPVRFPMLHSRDLSLGLHAEGVFDLIWIAHGLSFGTPFGEGRVADEAQPCVGIVARDHVRARSGQGRHAHVLGRAVCG